MARLAAGVIDVLAAATPGLTSSGALSRLATADAFNHAPAFDAVPLDRRRPLDDLMAALALEQRHLQPVA